MIQPSRVRRRVEAVVASLIVAAASLGLVLGRHDVAEAVAEDKGAVTISAPDGAALTGGGSATEFRMTPPTDSACPGWDVKHIRVLCHHSERRVRIL